MRSVARPSQSALRSAHPGIPASTFLCRHCSSRNEPACLSPAASPDARCSKSDASFVAPLAGVNVVELQRFLHQVGAIAVATVPPGGHVAVELVVAQGLTLVRLIFLAEVSATGFIALTRVDAHQLGQLKIVRDARCLFKTLVEVVAAAGHLHIL